MLVRPHFGSQPSTGSSGAMVSASTIGASCWFDGSSDYLTSTSTIQGTEETNTTSLWVKRTALSGGTTDCFTSHGTTNLRVAVYFDGNDKLRFDYANAIRMISTAVFRDLTGWYHIVWHFNTTSSPTLRVWVNNNEITDWDSSSLPTASQVMHYLNNSSHGIGTDLLNNTRFHGYIAQYCVVDGSALLPTSFGQANATTGLWEPLSDATIVALANAGGSGSFALTSAIGDGTDASTNSNDFTPTSMSQSANGSDDSPSNNFAVLNAIDLYAPAITISNGALVSNGASSSDGAHATMSIDVEDDKGFYWEATLSGTSTSVQVGLAMWPYGSDQNGLGAGSNTLLQNWNANGTLYNAAGTASAATYASGDTLQFFVRSGKLWLGVNGTWAQSGAPNSDTNEIVSGMTGLWTPMFSTPSGSVTWTVNFGQTSFAHTPPTDALMIRAQDIYAQNVPPDDPTEHFNAVLYIGNGTAIGSGGNAVTGVGHQPDFVWIKNRDATDQHVLTDVIRGTTNYLSTDGSDAEATATETLTSFGSDGFTVGSDVQVNTTTEDYVAWCWKAGGTGVANTSGTISGTVSVNATAGFSIVSWTGNATGGATVGHGLGIAPKFILVKNAIDVVSWHAYHEGVASDPETDAAQFDTGVAFNDGAGYWNDTAPTSTVFSLGTVSGVNGSSDDMVAYCFAEIPGYSMIGSYTGNNNANGSYVYCGFKPRFVMIKNVGATASWAIYDTARDTYNQSDANLYADTTGAESAVNELDFLSTGFKLRNTDATSNAAVSFVFIAFAEDPRMLLAR